MRVWFVLLLLAGCAAPAPEPTDVPVLDDVPDVPAVPDPPLAALDQCMMVGGLSIYPLDRYAAAVPMPEGIELLDIRPLVDEPAIASANGAGWVTPGAKSTGHWHVAAACDGARWGFVGIAIEPPAWHNDTADLNILLAVWSWTEQHLEAMHHAGHATHAQDVVATATGPARSLLLEDADHGRYEGTFLTGAASTWYESDAGTIRFWMLLPEEGHHNHHDQTGPFHPVSFDLVHDGLRIIPSTDTDGFFMHSGTDHHAPLPALGGNALGVTMFLAGAIHQGPAPAVALNTTWVH